ncbi:MAG: hypothetical protein ABIY37_05610 [Devosia sp.]
MSEAKQPAKGRQSKTAVVVIHGIGEQRPLGTIKEFVETVYRRDRSLATRALGEIGLLDVPIVPDSSTGSAELRRLTTLADGPPKRTDFFELYWADIMDGTPVDMVTGWIQTLLLRSPWRLPNAKKVQRAWWILVGIVAVIAAAGYITIYPDWIEAWALSQWIGRWVNRLLPFAGALSVAAAVALVLWRWGRAKRKMSEVKLLEPAILLVVGLVLLLLPAPIAGSLRFWAGAATAGFTWALTAIITPYAGDVVRYVRATPSTVERRRQVRERGMALLEVLHKKRLDGETICEDFTQAETSNPPLYDRIVIVGHSLGTIIAYDLVQLFWEKHGPTHHQAWKVGAPGVQEALAEADAHVKAAWGKERLGFSPDAFRMTQDKLYTVLHDAPPRWRISDLITLGSPLTHAEFLLADSENEVQQAFVERRFATCPPRPDPMRDGSMLFPARGQEEDVLFPHFAAQFAAVRWTNIYDEDENPLLGDLISGSLTGSYGPGIAQHAVSIERPNKQGWRRRVFTHTRYWTWHESYEPSEASVAAAAKLRSLDKKRALLWENVPEHIKQLRLALNLGT